MSISFPIKALIAIVTLMLVCCVEDTDSTLAPYQGYRELEIIYIMHSPEPDIQWLGGRVAAVGVNQGDKAALDSTLIWLMTAEDNAIDSYVTYGTDADTDKIQQCEGEFIDSLSHKVQYTFWLAEKDAYDANLASAYLDEHTFVDTTFELSYILSGRLKSGYTNIEEIRIEQNETILTNTFTVSWLPADKPFREIGILKRSLPSNENLSWHIRTSPDSLEDNIFPPIIIGEQIPGTIEIVPWESSGFLPDEDNLVVGATHVIWLVDDRCSCNYTKDDVGLAYMIIYEQ